MHRYKYKKIGEKSTIFEFKTKIIDAIFEIHEEYKFKKYKA